MNRTLLAAVAAAALAAVPALAADPIKIGIPVGLSGANSVVAPSVVQSAELAVEEINAKGGIMGKKVVLEVADDGSGAAGAQKAFDSLIFQKKVNVLISMETSAARNAGLPIVTRGKTPFIYTSFYEGRSCNKYLYVNAWVPDQQVAPIVDYFMKKYNAKTFFLIGSDYAFGRGMLEFTRGYIEKKGGKVLGEEYLPMDGSDWTRDHQQAQGGQARRADHLHRGRRAERHADQAAARGRHQHSVRQPRGRRRHGQEHGPGRRRHLHLRLLLHQHRQPEEQGIPGRDAEEVRRRSEDAERSLGAGVRGRLRSTSSAVEKAGSTDAEKVIAALSQRLLRWSARHDPDEQAAPRAAHHVPGPGAEGRQRQDPRDVQGRRSRALSART